MTYLEANPPSQLDSSIESAAQQLRQIIDEARRRNAANLSGAAVPPACAAAFYDMQRHMYVNARWNIVWPRSLYGKVSALYQKISRRLLRWYIDSIVSQQNQFNLATLRAVQAVLCEMQAMQTTQAERDAEQQSRLTALAERVSALERTLAGQ